MAKVNAIANYINHSKTTQRVLKYVNKNPAMAVATASFLVASIARPMAVMCLPMKDKKDKIYTACSAIATGISELALSAALFIPMGKLLDKTSQALYNSKGSAFFENKLMLRNFKTINNRIFKLATLPIAAYARFALISPLVKFLFKKDKAVAMKGGKQC